MFSSPIVAMIGLAFGFALIYAGIKDQPFLSVLQGKDTSSTRVLLSGPSLGTTSPGTVNSPQTSPGTVPIPGRTKVVAQ